MCAKIIFVWHIAIALKRVFKSIGICLLLTLVVAGGVVKSSIVTLFVKG